MEKQYYKLKEVAEYFDISISTLNICINKYNIKRTYITGKAEDWGNKTIRISKTQIEKLESLLPNK